MNLEMRLYTLLPLPPCGMWPEKGQRREVNCGAKDAWCGLCRGRRLEIRDDTALDAELVLMVREHNYIPTSAAGLYAAAPWQKFHADRR